MKQENEEPRPRKYVYPTWITKLLAGESRCWYSAWYKSNFKYQKKADDPERAAFFAEYNEKHDTIVRHRALAMKLEGWVVKTEEPFRVAGKAGDISGRIDIVGMKGDEALVVEVKSGRPRQSDHFQALLYVLLLPLDWLRGFKTVRGEVEYLGGTVGVKPLTPEDRAKISDALKSVMGGEPLPAVPSEKECLYCDVVSCRYRYQASSVDVTGGIF